MIRDCFVYGWIIWWEDFISFSKFLHGRRKKAMMGQEEDEFEIKIIAGLKPISKSMPNIAIILYKKEFWQ